MAIPAILKGDTSGSIVLDIKAGYEYEGCTLAVVFNGVRKEFTGLVAGGTKSLQYTADETAGMPLGTAHATMTLTNAAGVVRSMPWVRIRVTDIPAEIYDRHIDVDPSQLDVEPAKAGDSLGEVKAKLNAVMAFLRGGAACLLACVGLASLGDIGPTTPLNDVPGDTTISNLVVKSGVSTGGGGGGGCDTNAVDILANAAVVTNALTVATTNRVAALETATNNLSSSVSGLASSVSDISSSVSGLASSKADRSYIETVVLPSVGDAHNLAESANQKVDSIYPVAMDASQKAYEAVELLSTKADRSMISATNPTFSNEVATVARTVTPPPSPTLRLYDGVRQCYWIGRMINGVINWEVE